MNSPCALPGASSQGNSPTVVYFRAQAPTPELRHVAPAHHHPLESYVLAKQPGQGYRGGVWSWSKCAQRVGQSDAQLSLFPAPSEVRPPWVHLTSTIATTTEEKVQQLLDPPAEKSPDVATSHWVKARITPRGITLSVVHEGGQGNPEALARGRARIKEHGFSGAYADKAKAKVRRRAENWLYGLVATKTGSLWDRAVVDALTERRYVLLTLTLPADQMHTDQEVKRQMLSLYLRKLKRKCHASNYMWFAETQRNGRIHFHLILDRYIKKVVAQTLWNEVLDEPGYIAAYRAGRESWHAGGFRYDSSNNRTEMQQRRAYEEGVRTGWSQPPTADIRGVKGGAQGVLAYVVEYCAKGANGEPDDVRRKVEGHLWGCNRELGKLESFSVEVTTELHRLIEAKAEAGELHKIEGDHWSHYAGDIGRLLAYELPHLYHGFLAHWRVEAGKLCGRRKLRRAARQEQVKKARPTIRVAGTSSGRRPDARVQPHRAQAAALVSF